MVLQSSHNTNKDMIKHILERNRRTREYDKISNKCVRYAFKPKLYAHYITIDNEGITMGSIEKSLRGNSYVWFEVCYNKLYVIIKDISSGICYYLYPKKINIEILSMLIHDIIVTGSDILFLLDDSNNSMKNLIKRLEPNLGKYSDSNELYAIIQLSTSIQQHDITYITYNVDSPVIIYSYNVNNGYYNIDKILSIPSIGRIFKIISKYVVFA